LRLLDKRIRDVCHRHNLSVHTHLGGESVAAAATCCHSRRTHGSPLSRTRRKNCRQFSTAFYRRVCRRRGARRSYRRHDLYHLIFRQSTLQSWRSQRYCHLIIILLPRNQRHPNLGAREVLLAAAVRGGHCCAPVALDADIASCLNAAVVFKRTPHSILNICNVWSILHRTPAAHTQRKSQSNPLVAGSAEAIDADAAVRAQRLFPEPRGPVAD
jgi:hypothetical protein